MSPPAWEYCDVNFCERQVDDGVQGHVYPECRVSEKGIEYVGTKNETKNGKPCRQWDDLLHELTYPYFVSFHLLTRAISPENYCRNTGQLERPWCLIPDHETMWEYCDIPVCDDPNPPECKLSPSGVEYLGKMNVTITGYPCKPWLETCANKPGLCEQFGLRLSDELFGNHRFCRNPTTTLHGPLCYIDSDDGPEWEYCEVPFCPPADGKQCDIRVDGLCVSPQECKVDKKWEKYIGTKNVTRNGFQCQRWLSNFPNNQLNAINYDDSDYYYSGRHEW
ncbi:unnamed protein product [Darwinula stevensoni]|uniref:Kringle domain-containing protein n=1 Tax=Darwinula stevensoni TaxID=69355 RepID=A0A7R8X7Z9_9CRUS|nr:unnamed protein product [Darwinula stevensoni]CAG0889619.1 unnamed protein product [Darwinula stevensoni]